MNYLFLIPALIIALYLADIMRLNYKLNLNLTKRQIAEYKSDIFFDYCIILTLLLFIIIL